MMQGTQTNVFGTNKDQSCLAHHQSIVLSLQLNNWRQPDASRSNIKHHLPTCNVLNWSYFWTSNLPLTTSRWQEGSVNIPSGCRSGGSGGPKVVSLSKIERVVVASRFPPRWRELLSSRWLVICLGG
ncbi:MAG: hypothetical protein M3R15_30590, partial [Acidobacteriota bacterium]|nr:hypothetical protein [Acidobacteriota bacterium]